MTFQYFLRRLFYTFPVIFGVTLICFLIFNVVGGDPALQFAGKNASFDQIISLRHELGLDQPFYKQYFLFLKQVITFDWGESWQTHENINDLLIKGLGPSLSLTLPAFFLNFIISIALALYTTSLRKTWIDPCVTTFCLGLMSLSFLVYIIVYQYVFAFYLNLFPINGWNPDFWLRWRYLLLPWLISITVSLGPSVLIYRSVLMDETLQDYVITAKAKGLSQFVIYLKHILKNAMIPISTFVMMQIPFLMTGSLLLEAFFGIPGLGGLLMQAIQNSDFPVIRAMTVMGSLTYLLFNLVSDFVYTFFDPRVNME